MKLIICFFIIIFGLQVFARWDDPNAEFRVVVEFLSEKETGWLSFRSIGVPVTTENRFRIYNESGKPVPFHLYDSNSICIPHNSAKKLYVYFGYKKQQPFFRLDPKKYNIPLPHQLRVRNICPGENIPENIRTWKHTQLRKRFSRHTRLLREQQSRFAKLREQMLFRNFKITDLKVRPVRTWTDYRRECLNAYFKYLNALDQELYTNAEDYLYDHFKDKKHGSDATRLFFFRRPFDTDRTFVTCFSGRLVIPENGEYSFCVNTNATRLLKIDGRKVVRTFGPSESNSSESVGTSETVTLSLKKGTVPFEFLYYKGMHAIWAAVKWKKADAHEWKLLTDQDFAPSAPMKVLSLEGRDGSRYPLVNRNESMQIFTEKHRCFRLEMLNTDCKKCKWLMKGQYFEGTCNAFAVDEKVHGPFVEIIPSPETGLKPMKIQRISQPGNKVYIENLSKLNLILPAFLSDDEYGDICLQARSRFPERIFTVLKTHASQNDIGFKGNTTVIDFPAVPMEQENHFLPDHQWSRSWRFEASKLVDPIKVDFEIGLPGLMMDRAGFLISSVKDLPELHVTAQGLCDPDGRHTLIVLHRKTLHEVRSNELIRNFFLELFHTKKILVIAEDFGMFRQELQKRAASSWEKLFFVRWNKSFAPSGSPALNSIPEILKVLNKNDIDTVVIIPLNRNRRGIAGERTELDIVSLIIEKALSKKTVKRIVLTTPLASYTPENDFAFHEKLRKLRREKGINFVELQALCRKFLQNDSYFDGVNYSDLPVGDALKIANELFDEIRKNR